MNTNRVLLDKNLNMLNRSINRFLSTPRKGTPLTMSFLVTNRCNLRCKHCFYHYSNSTRKDISELTVDEYIKISSSMENFMKAIFSGGEPFLRDDLYEIVNIFQKRNKVLWCSSSTNGQDTEKIITQVKRIVSHNQHHHFSLALSLDGFEEQHDLIRGIGTFKKAVETWKEMKALCTKHNNLEIYICPTVTSINKSIMPNFIDWAIRELNPAFVSILKARQEPRDGSYLKEVTSKEYDLCKNEIENQISMNKMGDVNQPQTYISATICYYVSETLKSGKRSFNCLAGKYGGFIDFNGNVGICEVMPFLGNIRNYDCNFLSLWNADRNIAKKNMAESAACCYACTHETEGIIPSMFFGENEIKTVL